MTNDSKLIRNSVICLRALGMTSSLHFCKAAHSTSRYNIPHPAPPMSPKTAPRCVVKRAQLHRDSPSPQSLRLSLASDLDPGASWVQMTSINQSLKGTQNSKRDDYQEKLKEHWRIYWVAEAVLQYAVRFQNLVQQIFYSSFIYNISVCGCFCLSWP